MTAAIPTIAEAGRQIAAKQLSPVELTKACFERVHALDDQLHAFVHLTEERALAEARAAEAAIMANGPNSPLHGIPIGLKDIVDTKGIPTTCPVETAAGQYPRQQMRPAPRSSPPLAASVLMNGKLTTHEFADGGPSFDLPATAGAPIGGTRIISPPAAAAAPARGGCRRHDPLRHRHRHRRVDPRTGGLLRHRGSEADLRARQPRRRRSGRF